MLRTLLVTLALVLQPGFARAGAEGPSLYFCFDATQSLVIQIPFTGICAAESPFASLARSGALTYFHLYDAGGYQSATGITTVPLTGTSGGTNNSVDADDGVIDNLGLQQTGLTAADTTYTFDPIVLGALPTHVGIVVTLGGPPSFVSLITFEAFGPGGASLGTIGPVAAGGFNDASQNRFFGWSDLGGISSFRVRNTTDTSNLLVDHLQYGRVTQASPVPLLGIAARSGIAMLVLAIGALLVRPRRRAG